MFVGYFYGILVWLVIFEDVRWFLVLLVLFGVVIGVYFVGNIGCERGDFKYFLMGFFIVNIVLIFLIGDEVGVMYVVLFFVIVF